MNSLDVIDISSNDNLKKAFEPVHQHLVAGSSVPTKLLVNWLRAMQLQRSLEVPIVLLSPSPTDLALRKSCEYSGRALQLADLISVLTNRGDTGLAPSESSLL